jgi:RHS repeat-associated protein
MVGEISNVLRQQENPFIPYTCEVFVAMYSYPADQSAGAGLRMWGEPWAWYGIVATRNCHEQSSFKNWYISFYAKGYPFDINNATKSGECGEYRPVAPQPKTNCGNPINVMSGNKYQAERDIDFPSMSFTRYYNSVGDRESEFGNKWTHDFSSAVMGSATGMSTAGTMTLYVRRPDGTRKRFIFNNGNAVDDRGVPSRQLKPIVDQSGGVTGWEYGRNGESVELYDGNGRLVAINKSRGERITVSYDPAFPSRISAVTDARGRAFEFVYLPNGKLDSIRSGGIALVQYAYNADGMLSLAGYGDSTSRTYRYNEQGNTSGVNAPTLLTSIVDESQNTLSSFSYSADGKAVGTVQNGGVQSFVATYPTAQDGVVEVSQPLGATSRYDFDMINGHQRLASVTTQSAQGQQTESFTYDAYGRIDVTTNKAGTQTNYDYGSNGRISAVTYAYNLPAYRNYVSHVWDNDLGVLTEQATYDSSSSVPGVQIQKRNWTYNARGQVLAETVTDPAGASAQRTTTTAYCEQADVVAGTCPLIGLLKRVDGPRTDVNDVMTYSYYPADASGCAQGVVSCDYRRGDLRTVTNGLGHTTEILRYDVTGRPVSTRDANGVVTDLQYDGRGRLLSRKVRGSNPASEADDQVTSIEYWPTGLVKKVVRPDGGHTSYTYDGAQRLVGIADGAGNTISYTLNAAGEKTREEIRDGQGALLQALSKTYDTFGQLQSQIDAYGRATTFTRDALGNADQTTDALGRIADDDYDPLNRLRRSLRDVNGVAAETTYSYNTLGKVVRTVDPNGLNTDYAYNGFGDLTRLQSPDTGSTTYGYDAAGNRISRTDARNVQTQYTYDALKRVVAVVYPQEPALNVSYLYDIAQSDCIAGETFLVGRLAKMTDGSGSTTYCYDRFGQMTRKVQRTQDKTFTLRWSYAASGRLQTMTYPDGAIVDYVYDAQGRIAEIGVTSEGRARRKVVSSVQYHPFGGPARWESASGRILVRTQNQNGQSGVVQAQDLSGNPVSGLSVGYEFDEVGNLKRLRDGNQAEPPLRTYRYDGLNRLIEAKDGAGVVWESYAYDRTGNRTSSGRLISTTTQNCEGVQPGEPCTPGPTVTNWVTRTYNLVPQSHRVWTIGNTERRYDDAGNTVWIGLRSVEFEGPPGDPGPGDPPPGEGGESAAYAGTEQVGIGLEDGNEVPPGIVDRILTYNAANRLSALSVGGQTTITYRYNGNGERVYRSGSGQTAYTMFDAVGQWIGDFDGNGQMLQQMIWFNGLPVGLVTKIDGAPRLLHVEPDALGTPRAVIDPTRGTLGTVVWRWDPSGEAFGEDVPDQDPDGDGAWFVLDQRFPGQQYDSETGFNYNYFRDYDAATGRYVESDPIGLAGGINTYAYSQLSPLTNRDMYGLRVDWSGTVVGGSAISVFGAGFFLYDLTSECVNGKRAHAKVVASAVAAGGGLTYTGSGSSAKFYDFRSTPEPEVFNGAFVMWSAGVAAGSYSLGCSMTTMGDAYTEQGLFDVCSANSSRGIDASFAIFLGASVVVSSQVWDCDHCTQ